MSDAPADAAFETHETLRMEAAGALRALIHAYVGHEIDDSALVALRDWVRAQTAELAAGTPRDRASVMRRASEGLPSTEWRPAARAGFEDRAVAGEANPTSIGYEVRRDGDTMLTEITFDSAFEG